MTMSALKKHPKVYWIWNHRRWCLENVPDGPGGDGEEDANGWKQANWTRELQVVERMLDADARNCEWKIVSIDFINWRKKVLAWSYRRYVLGSMPVPRSLSSELNYTTKKIESNFSNFSAWHQRSKVYVSLWSNGGMDEKKSKEEEFELVRNALYTDPSDSSAWVYHRWLIGSGEDREQLGREIAVIEELLAEQPDSKCKWISLYKSGNKKSEKISRVYGSTCAISNATKRRRKKEGNAWEININRWYQKWEVLWTISEKYYIIK